MEGHLNDFIDWMAAIPPLGAYAVLLLIAYGENVVPPIPGDLAVVFGGYLVAVGRLNFAVVVLLATVGGALGFMTMYALGRRIGDAVFDPDRLRWLPKREIWRARTWLQRWGYGVVAANRFLSGARSVISLTVGMARMHAGWTACWATLSALVWTMLIAYGGYELGENWPRVIDFLKTYGRAVLLVLVVLFAAVLYRRYRKKGAKDPSDSQPFD